jgi:hypothetical protein
VATKVAGTLLAELTMSGYPGADDALAEVAAGRWAAAIHLLRPSHDPRSQPRPRSGSSGVSDDGAQDRPNDQHGGPLGGARGQPPRAALRNDQEIDAAVAAMSAVESLIELYAERLNTIGSAGGRRSTSGGSSTPPDPRAGAILGLRSGPPCSMQVPPTFAPRIRSCANRARSPPDSRASGMNQRRQTEQGRLRTTTHPCPPASPSTQAQPPPHRVSPLQPPRWTTSREQGPVTSRER